MTDTNLVPGNPTPDQTNTGSIDNVGNKTPDVTNVNKVPDIQLSPEKQAAEDKRIADGLAADAAAKEAADKAAADKKVEEDNAKAPEFHEFQDEAAGAVVQLLKDAGVSATEANAWFDEAYKTGDLTKINWTAVATKLTPAQIVLAKAGVQQHYEGAYKEQQAVVTAVHDVFGGQDNWAKVVEWAQTKESKDPAFKKTVDEVRAGLKQNVTVATASANHLKSLFDADPATKGLGVGKITNGDTTVQDAGAPLSRADYYNETVALNKRKHSQAEAANLWARRQAGIATGI